MFLCVLMAVPVLDSEWKGGKWDREGAGKKRESKHVCESRSLNAPAELSLLLVNCGGERDTP